MNFARNLPADISKPSRVGTALFVQYGCGLSAPKNWVNFDSSPRLRLEKTPIVSGIIVALAGRLFPKNVRVGNIVKGLPVPDGSASGVYCSHILEHLPRDELPVALKNTLRILVPGGIFRLVVPDLVWRAKCYLDAVATQDKGAVDTFFEACQLGRRRRPRNLMGIARDYLGGSAHFWMYDFGSLKALLEEAGFTRVRRCEFGDSAEPAFAEVEDRERFFDQGQSELAIEALRPQGPNSRERI
jgi:predicted SAM-dependent methyltransferase